MEEYMRLLKQIKAFEYKLFGSVDEIDYEEFRSDEESEHSSDREFIDDSEENKQLP